MKKIISTILTICVLMATINVYANESIEEPNIVADGAILMDFKTGRVLYEKNADKPLAMASTTKIMTLIIALESGRLDETVIASRNAQTAPKVRLNISEGEEFLLSDLLYPLMLESSNDTAVAIAEHLGGSVEGFSVMMNEKAQAIGCTDTVFVTPNGLDSGDHHSTARDLALITRYALNNQLLMEYINTQTKTIKSNLNAYTVTNKNRLLNEYGGANGVKTGFTNKAGQCFVGAAKRDDMQLITVALASGWGDSGKEQKWIDTKNMLDYGFDNYKYYDIVKEGQDAGEIDVLHSKTPRLDVVFDRDITLPLNELEAESLKYEKKLNSYYEAPITTDAIVGVLEISLDNEFLAEAGIETVKGATRHDFRTKVNQIIASWLI